MVNKLKSNKGFTLIELLIVVAIIGILAAIAIPQFAKYRVQGFNASALSDVKNLRTSEESMYAEYQRYGATEAAALPGSGAATGAVITGPGTAAAPTIITTTDNVGTARGLQVAVGNNIYVGAIAIAATFTSYNAVSKHLQGDTAYAADADSTANFKFANFPTAATAIGYKLLLTDVVAPTTPAVDFTAAGWVSM